LIAEEPSFHWYVGGISLNAKHKTPKVKTETREDERKDRNIT
jgi:hypothetical protein